jgi:CRISPR-associated endonuclease Cas2
MDYGTRVQESVFWVEVDEELRSRMEARLRRVVLCAEDVLWIVPVCARCREGMTLMGPARPREQAPYWVI